MPDVVTIAHFSEPLEAEMARLRLQSGGIETFLSGENARIMEPGLGPLSAAYVLFLAVLGPVLARWAGPRQT